MNETNKQGELAELQIEIALTSRDYVVSKPSVDTSYDMVVDVDGEMLRVQCKKARMKDGSFLSFNTSTTDSNGKRYYKDGALDIFAVYSPELEQVYIVPFDDAPKSHMRLRLSGGDSQSNMAEDYLLDKMI